MNRAQGLAGKNARAVIYLTGDLGQEYRAVLRLSEAVKVLGWSVVTVRADRDATKTAWLRRGLLSAITLVCHDQADCIVMSQATFDALLPDDQNWLQLRLKHFDGFLHTIPPQGEASAR